MSARTLVGAVLCLVACGEPVASQEPARSAGADWPDFQGPNRDSKSPETGILTDWPDAGPRVVWTRALGTSYGTVTVADGRLYHFDRIGDVARLTAMKPDTGDELWRFEYPSDYTDLYGYANGPRCCPVVDGDLVFVLGAGGMLHAVRAEDGAVAWKRDTTADYGVSQNFFGVGSTPIVEGGLLIALIGGSPPGSPDVRTGLVRGNGTGIVAFDKRTGEEKWRATDELASYASPVTATIDGRRWGFVFARGGLVGFEPSTGKVDFHYPWRARLIESVNAATPVVVGDRVFITECYGVGSALVRVAPGEVETVWSDADQRGRDRAMMAHWATPIHVDGHLYGSSGRHSREAELRCISLETGEVKWSKPGLTRSSLLYADGHFVCLGEDGVLRLLKVDPTKYVEVARAVLRDGDGKPLLEYPAWAAPVLSHGRLYVRGADRLVCLELIPK